MLKGWRNKIGRKGSSRERPVKVYVYTHTQIDFSSISMHDLIFLKGSQIKTKQE